ncbi:MAG: FAD-dependent oxidoreductase [Ramlibacter sp.]|nr:FAD-dependent oxidoreductase [Ramlibacter sp.]
MAKQPRNIAVIGAGIAGLACARTLAQAGHRVTVLDKNPVVGGRLASCDTPFGTFDHGAQYFTVRDARFQKALATTPGLCKPWSANAVRVLDPHGRVAEAAVPAPEPHWVAVPAMDALPRHWAQPLAAGASLVLETRVTRIERDTLDHQRWQLQTSGPQDSVHVYSGFDAVVLAVPQALAAGLLNQSAVAPGISGPMAHVEVAPCWTLMLAYPQAQQPTLNHLGPQWNAAMSTHHRIAWLARESSKPGRGGIERWTVQGSPAWSQEHVNDDGPRVQAKLLKAFAEVTGIYAEPTFAQVHRWMWAKTMTPLGRSHLWDAKAGIGACGDWCLGHRVEDAFISGLELALAVHKG